MAKLGFADSPEWFGLNFEEQAATRDIAFEDIVGKTQSYIDADDSTRIEARKLFDQDVDEVAWNSQYNEKNINKAVNQYDTDTSSAWGTSADILKSSFTRAKDQIGLTDDVASFSGEMDSNAAAISAKLTRKQAERGITPSQEKLANRLDQLNEERSTDDTWKDAKAWGSFVLDAVTDNLEGVRDTALESVDSIVKMGLGGLAGTKIGAGAAAITGGWATPAIPVFTAAGAIGGGLEAELVPYFQAAAEKELVSRGLIPNERNYRTLYKEQDWVDANRKKAKLKAAGTSLVDYASAHLFSRIATLPTRAARRTALRSLTKSERKTFTAMAKDLDQPVSKIMDAGIDQKAAKLLSERSMLAKVRPKVVSYAGEVASEPLSEAAGTALAGDEITAKELIYETLGGIGAGPIGAGINTALFGTKLAKDSTGALKNAITTRTPEVVAQKKINNEVHTNKYKEEIKASTVDTDITGYIDPKTDRYDPVKAVDILNNIGTEHSLNQAKDIQAEFMKEVTPLIHELQALGKNENPTKAEKKAYLKLAALVNEKGETFNNLKAVTKALEEKVLKEFSTKQAKDASTESSVLNSLGSHEPADQIIKNKAVAKSIKEGSASTETKALYKQLQSMALIEEKISDSKTIASTRFDVLSGGGSSGFRGIRSFIGSITRAVQSGDTKTAQAELTKLQNFRSIHGNKADTFNELFKVAKSKGKLTASPEVLTHFEELKTKGEKLKEIHINSGELVDAVNLEVSALQQSIKLAESIIGLGASRETPKEASSAKANSTKKEKESDSTKKAKEPKKPVKKTSPDKDVAAVNPQTFSNTKGGTLPSAPETINIYAGSGENTILSNFAIRPFKYGPKVYQSVEQLFQLFKISDYVSEKPNSTEEEFSVFNKAWEKLTDQILQTTSGAELKRLGNTRLPNSELDSSWDTDSVALMKDGILESFLQNPKAAQELLATGNATLTHTQDKSKWGKLFPKLLMEVRSELEANGQKAIEAVEDRINAAAIQKLGLGLTNKEGINEKEKVETQSETEVKEAQEETDEAGPVDNFSGLDVEVKQLNGQSMTMSYDDAIGQLQEEIDLYKKIGNCLKIN